MKFRASLALSLLITLLLAACPVFSASAQNPTVTFESVRIDIWPEYDRPAALVILNLALSPQTSLPAAMRVRIPVGAGKPHAVAWQSPDKTLFDLQYDTVTTGPWTEIQFTTPAQDIRIEYYDPSLKKTGNQRDFIFRWPGDYTVQDLTIKVQQPANATNVVFRPNAGTGQPEADGLTYYTVAAGTVNANVTFDLAISYTKADDGLTNPQQFQPAQASQPVNPATTGGMLNFNQVLPFLLGGAGLLLIGFGLWWYWRGGVRVPKFQAETYRPRHAARRTRQKNSENNLPPSTSGDSAGSFCHQCGKKAAPGDVFCRVCGTRLR